MEHVTWCLENIVLLLHDDMLIRAGCYTFSLRSSSSTIKTKLSNKFRTSPGIVIVHCDPSICPLFRVVAVMVVDVSFGVLQIKPHKKTALGWSMSVHFHPYAHSSEIGPYKLVVIKTDW